MASAAKLLCKTFPTGHRVVATGRGFTTWWPNSTVESVYGLADAYTNLQRAVTALVACNAVEIDEKVATPEPHDPVEQEDLDRHNRQMDSLLGVVPGSPEALVA